MLLASCAPPSTKQTNQPNPNKDTTLSIVEQSTDTIIHNLDTISPDTSTNSLSGKWILKTLDKKDFKSMKEVFIDLNTSEKRFNGCNGCNNMFGSISFDVRERYLEFDNIGATKMACEGDGEYTFMQVFGGKHKFQFNYAGKSLTLYKNGKSIEFVRPVSK